MVEIILKINKEQILGIILIIFCLIMFFFLIPTQISSPKERFFPKLIITFLLFNSLCLILRASRISPNKMPNKLLDKGILVRFILILSIFLIYIIIIGIFGFFISSFLFLSITMFFLKVRDWRILIIIPITLLAFIHFIMEKLLFFNFPNGIFF